MSPVFSGACGYDLHVPCEAQKHDTTIEGDGAGMAGAGACGYGERAWGIRYDVIYPGVLFSLPDKQTYSARPVGVMIVWTFIG